MNRTWPTVAISVATATLLLGYGDLWRGGETLSAVLLTVGYMIMVPAAIMAVPQPKGLQK